MQPRRFRDALADLLDNSSLDSKVRNERCATHRSFCTSDIELSFTYNVTPTIL